MAENLDRSTVAGFGDEWSRFDQTGASAAELDAAFTEYFAVFPWSKVSRSAIGADFGCGSGRWAARVVSRVAHLHLLDASGEALAVARRNLAHASNCSFHETTIEAAPIADASLDFGYSLGVLHHIPDTVGAMKACARKLKPGAPMLVYLYYRFDNRPAWYRWLWERSEAVRSVVSRLPHSTRYAVSQALAAGVYWPLARGAKLVEMMGGPAAALPLSYYRNRSFYAMRNDALDRFGTRLEQRFTRIEIASMMHSSGLERVEFSPTAPYWCAIGYRRG